MLFFFLSPSFSPITIFIFSSLLHTSSSSSSSDTPTLPICLTNFHCGTLKSIPYPFTGGDRPSRCGPPEFQITCSNGVPLLNISSVSYRILQLNPIGRVLTLARTDLWNETCTRNFVNSTFDSVNFSYGSGNENLTLLYACNRSSEINIRPENLFECEFQGNRNDSYSWIGPFPEDSVLATVDCYTRIEVPILQNEARRFSSNRSLLREVLMSGFNVNYSSPYENECDGCAKSGGECGYNETDRQFSCFCREGPQKTSCSKGSSLEESSKPSLQLKIAIGISAGVAALVLMSIMIICNRKKCFRIKRRNSLKETKAYHNNHHNLETFMKDYGSLAPKKYSYSEVKRMTNSFSEKLGQGGYGAVYKGSLPDGRLAAMKVLSMSKGSGEEFMNEVASISRTSHINIVTLLGFCHKRNKQVLIYEYMPNGSLDKFIYKRESSGAFCTLEWKVLYQIAIGIARGLEYLHRGCNTRIVHFDIKPQNILLDENFCPKISDFGLAKLCKKKESIVSIMGTRGTIGFIAPEMLSRAFGGVSHKSDVYSYGMLVLEMVGGRKNYDSGGSSQIEEMYFPDWIYKDLEKGNIHSSHLAITEEENEVIRKMTFVSLWCIQTNPSDRPAINKVVEMLEGPLQSLTLPPKPSLNSPTRSAFHLSNGSSSEILETNSIST